VFVQPDAEPPPLANSLDALPTIVARGGLDVDALALPPPLRVRARRAVHRVWSALKVNVMPGRPPNTSIDPLTPLDVGRTHGVLDSYFAASEDPDRIADFMTLDSRSAPRTTACSYEERLKPDDALRTRRLFGDESWRPVYQRRLQNAISGGDARRSM
jgi:hypothetical protein